MWLWRLRASKLVFLGSERLGCENLVSTTAKKGNELILGRPDFDLRASSKSVGDEFLVQALIRDLAQELPHSTMKHGGFVLLL